MDWITTKDRTGLRHYVTAQGYVVHGGGRPPLYATLHAPDGVEEAVASIGAGKDKAEALQAAAKPTPRKAPAKKAAPRKASGKAKGTSGKGTRRPRKASDPGTGAVASLLAPLAAPPAE